MTDLFENGSFLQRRVACSYISGCGGSATRQSVLHITPSVITPSSPAHSIHKLRGRDSIPHLDDIQQLSDLVKRSIVNDDVDCRNNVRRRVNSTVNDVVGEAGVGKVVKKKTVIGDDVENEAKPAKRGN